MACCRRSREFAWLGLIMVECMSGARRSGGRPSAATAAAAHCLNLKSLVAQAHWQSLQLAVTINTLLVA